MGYGYWDADIYNKVTKRKIDTGNTFTYSAEVWNSGIFEPHKSMNIKGENGPLIRESRDSEDHPESTPIIIAFDETGSMGDNPRILQKELKELFGMLVRRDIVSDPQIAIAAYGDMYCDAVPVQFSQFESDNRIDDALDNVFIESGGGGNDGETSAVIPYYASKYIETDAWSKRRKKGYMFLIGDECTLGLEASHLEEFLGEKNSQYVSPQEAFTNASEKWDIYFILIDNFASRYQHSSKKYSKYIGKKKVIPLQDPVAVSSVIASIIAMNEKTVAYDELGTELAESGFSRGVIESTMKSVNGIMKSKKKDDSNNEREIDSTYPDLKL